MWSLESSNIIYYTVFVDMFLIIGQISSFLGQCVPYVLIAILYTHYNTNDLLILLGKMYIIILSPEKQSYIMNILMFIDY